MTDKKTEIGGVELSKGEIEAAKRDGVKDAIADGMTGALAADTGTKAPDDAVLDAQKWRVRPDLQSTFLAPLLDLGLDELKDRLTDEKHDFFIPFEEAKGLLHLERSAQNRTEYVGLLMKVIGVDDPYKVTSAGPGFTNDVTATTKL